VAANREEHDVMGAVVVASASGVVETLLGPRVDADPLVLLGILSCASGQDQDHDGQEDPEDDRTGQVDDHFTTLLCGVPE
jgi:hypothetical protein